MNPCARRSGEFDPGGVDVLQPRRRPFADPTLDYMAACGEVQARIRDVLTQLAGFAFLLATRRGRPVPGAGPLDLARVEAAEVAERLATLRPTDEAAHHFHHLSSAAEALGRSIRLGYACLSAGADEADRSAFTAALRAATEHLRATGRILPGFELVDLRQACCAAHMPPPASSPAALSCTAASGRN